MEQEIVAIIARTALWGSGVFFLIRYAMDMAREKDERHAENLEAFIDAIRANTEAIERLSDKVDNH